MEEEEQGHNFNNLRGRHKKSSAGGGGFSSCFGTTHHHHHHHHHRHASFDGDYSPSSTNKMRRSPSSGSWFKSKPENTKSRNFMSRIGGHRRHASADQFSYDPLSYALNFDDDAAASSSLDDHPAVSFTARLPASPPARTPTPDHHKLARVPPIPRSASAEKLAAGKEELRRGFEALSIRMKSNRKEADHTKTSNRAAAVEDVRRSLEPAAGPEEVTSPTRISSNRRGLLVQLC